VLGSVAGVRGVLLHFNVAKTIRKESNRPLYLTRLYLPEKFFQKSKLNGEAH